MVNKEVLLESLRMITKDHPAVIDIPTLVEDGAGHKLIFNMQVNLPSLCESTTSDGTLQTDKGVREIEPCIVYFDEYFPNTTPEISLRNDFCSNFPHINPIKTNRGILPCVYDGNLSDLMHSSEGFGEVLNHLTVWLNGAAIDSLLDPEQGWEPIRRDKGSEIAIINESFIKDKVSKRNSLGTRYFKFDSKGLLIFTQLENDDDLFTTYSKFRTQHKLDSSTSLKIGIIAWPNQKSTCSDYYPDATANFEGLYDQAKSYGLEIDHKFTEALDYAKKHSLPLDVLLIFVVRRPYNLIGTDSSIEIISYLINIDPKDNYDFGRVEPVTNVFKSTPELLSKASGIKVPKNLKTIALFGAGSLGSKIGMHLVRSGFDDFEVYDNSALNPHNQARHALFFLYEFYSKSHTFSTMAQVSMGTNVKPCIEDLRKLSNGKKSILQNAKNYSVVIDTTASNDVQTTLSQLPSTDTNVPLAQASLYSEGRMARYLVEGIERNPRIDDIDCMLIDKAVDDKSIQDLLFGESHKYDMVRIGEGCSSATLTMSDARVSLFASGIAERISKQLTTTFPSEGELLIGRLDSMDMGATWESIPISRFESLQTTDGWSVRIPKKLINEMRELLKNYRPSETGGILMGYINSLTLTMTVTRLIPAPPDSIFSAVEFTLGKEGVKEELYRVSQNSNGLITYLGTWHTHPRGGGASQTDKDTLKELVKERTPVPTIGLIVSHKLELIPGKTI